MGATLPALPARWMPVQLAVAKDRPYTPITGDGTLELMCVLFSDTHRRDSAHLARSGQKPAQYAVTLVTRSLFFWLALLSACVCTVGCVTRRLTVKSNPPGASLYIDDSEIGVTPVSTTYLRYGKRKFRLVKDGYETLTAIQPVPAPWYQIPPLDFLSENLIPGEIKDQRTLNFNLQPQKNVETAELRARAEELRAKTRSTQSGQATAGPVYPPPPDYLVVPPGGVQGVPPNNRPANALAP